MKVGLLLQITNLIFIKQMSNLGNHKKKTAAYLSNLLISLISLHTYVLSSE